MRDASLRAADLEPFLRRMRSILLGSAAMSPLPDRLAELRRHLDHLRELEPVEEFLRIVADLSAAGEA